MFTEWGTLVLDPRSDRALVCPGRGTLTARTGQVPGKLGWAGHSPLLWACGVKDVGKARVPVRPQPLSFPPRLAGFRDTAHLSPSDLASLAYQRVQKVDCTSLRPVLVLGPLLDVVKEMLVNEAPGKFCRCPLGKGPSPGLLPCPCPLSPGVGSPRVSEPT